jgi:hypothetical protein
MAINLLTFPSGTAPITGTYWSHMIDNLLAAVTPGRIILDKWGGLAGDPPVIKQGCYIRHAGSVYEVQTSDESIGGSISLGFNYLVLTESGSTLTAAWTNSISGYTYNPVYGGWYNGTTQLLFNACYYDGLNYKRAVSPNNLPYHWQISGGDIYINQTDLYTFGGDIDTGGGDITIDDLNINGDLNGDANVSGEINPSLNADSFHLIAGAGTYTFPRGSYVAYTSNVNIDIEVYINSGWRAITDSTEPYFFMTDGTNVRVNTSSGGTVYWRKY